jgi:hypothetical protein
MLQAICGQADGPLVDKQQDWCGAGGEARQRAALQRYLLSTVMPGITRALADIVLAKGNMTREEAVRVSCQCS